MARSAVRSFLLFALMLVSLSRSQTNRPPPASAAPDGAKPERSTGVIGLRLRETENKEFQVAEVAQAGPADKAGIKPSDVLLRVDDESILAYRLENLAQKLEGEPGTSVKLTLRRPDGERLNLNLVRVDRSRGIPRDAAHPPQPPSAGPGDAQPTGLSLALASTGAVRLRRVSVLDDARMIGGEAFSLLAPEDWKIDGGVRWRVHPAAPACLAFRVRSPDGRESVEALPAERFVWSRGGIPFFPSGSNYLGNEVAPPPPDARAFVQQFVLPRFRAQVHSVRIVFCEDLPPIAEAVESSLQEPGVPMKAKAARVRIEYAEEGPMYEEDIYVVLAFGQSPLIDYTIWGADRLLACRAPKGELEERTKLFQTIIASLQLNLAWYNKYLQLVDLIVKNQLQAIRQTGELSRYIARVNDDISDLRRQAWEDQQRTQQRVGSLLSRHLGGMEEYSHPTENRRVELPAGYGQVWSNPQGDYILSNDESFDPNTNALRHWRRLERNH